MPSLLIRPATLRDLPELCAWNAAMAWETERKQLDPAVLERLERRFASRGYRMSANNRRQAMVPAGAVAVPNPRGTAPGWWVERDGKIIIAMPGVPSEMTRMWEREALPRLRARAGATLDLLGGFLVAAATFFLGGVLFGP